MTRNRWIVLAAIGAVLAAGTAFFGSRLLRDEPEPPPVAEFSSTISLESTSQPEDTLTQDVQSQITSLVEVYYQRAFLQPQDWAEGAAEANLLHDQIFESFEPVARSKALESLDAFGLGILGPDFSRVEPDTQEVRITALADEGGSVTVVLATTGFAATATIAPEPPSFWDKLFDREPDLEFVDLSHRAEFWLRPAGDGYEIFAFKVDFTADQQVEAAAFGVPGGIDGS